MFRIGEFSKIARVSGRLLRYYDEIGLLIPIEIDVSTGYRYYSLTQLPRLNRIMALKDLGLTLDQIKQFIDNEISVSELRGMFTMKKAQIENTLREEIEKLRQIEVRLKQIEREGTLNDYDVIVKAVPSRRFLSLTTRITEIEQGFEIIQKMNQLLPSRVDLKSIGNFLTILRSEVFEDGDLTMQMGYLLNSDFDEQISLGDNLEMQVTELAPVETMAISIRNGIQSTALDCYTSLGRWIEMNDYQIVGSISELFHVMPPPSRPEDAVIEVQIPIQNVASSTSKLFET